MTGAAPRPPLAVREIAANHVRTDRTVTAWYRLAPQRWSFRGDREREELIRLVAAQMGALQGRRLHLRVTHRPFAVARWARAAHGNATGRPAATNGTLDWFGYLRGEQEHLASLDPVEKDVFLGVESVPGRRRAGAAELEPGAGLDHLLAGPGLAAAPATGAELAWLVARSVGLGLPVPAVPTADPDLRLTGTALAALSDRAAMWVEPGASTLTVAGTGREGELQRSRVVVLTLGPMDALHVPEADDPWMAQTDRLPFPVEWSARIDVRRSADVSGELRRQLGKVRSQVRHYVQDHGEQPPTSLARAAERLLEIEDRIGAGLTREQTRVTGWWRIAVSGRDEDETLARAEQVRDLYRPRVSVDIPRGQFRLAREFVPGEPVASPGHRRRGSALWAAAAMPTVTASVGDGRGLLVGVTSTAARRPVTWDPWLAQEVHQRSGLSAVVGGLGAGKSFLTGLIVYKSVMAGARWTVLDPSGPLARLAALPELAEHARHVNLMRGAPGSLNPYRMVADPRPADVLVDVDGDEDAARQRLREERRAAAATRRQLVVQTLLGLLPAGVAREPGSRMLLQRAVGSVDDGAEGDPGAVLVALGEWGRAGDEHARLLSGLLDERRDLPQSALLFPGPDGDRLPDAGDHRLTVLTMPGLLLPAAGRRREDWSDAEALGVELLNLACWLTRRGIDQAGRHVRKGVALDEAHLIAQVPTGTMLIEQLARDSRKTNVRALFVSQLAGDLLQVPGFAALADAVFVGRTEDEQAQAEALRLLRVPIGAGYEPLLAALSADARCPRQFVFADGAHGVETIEVDLEGPHLAHLRAILDTNPAAEADAASSVRGSTLPVLREAR